MTNLIKAFAIALVMWLLAGVDLAGAQTKLAPVEITPETPPAYRPADGHR